MNKKLVIIGAGPAGEAAARTAVKLTQNQGWDVVVVEKNQAGGVCLNKGCIPSKTLLENVHQAMHNGGHINWPQIQETKEKVVAGIRTALQNSLKTQKIQFVLGEAAFSGPKTLQISSGDKKESLDFDKAIITTGTEIFFPGPLEAHKNDILNSDRVLDLQKTPESVVVVGGGAVGLEFACLLNASGAKITVIERLPQILPGEDPAIVQALARALQKQGITIKTSMEVTDLKKVGKNWEVKLANGETLETQEVLSCVGRIPAPKNLNPEAAGIKLEKDRIVLNELNQTSNPDVYAAGDVTTTRLAHAAASQAEMAVANALGDKKVYKGNLIPRCLYSWPEVASVGEYKHTREEQNLPVKNSRAFYRGSAKALASGEAEGFVQLVVDPESKKVVGGQIIGENATEIIHTIALAIQAGMTTDQLSETVFAHPTLSEMIKEAAKK